MRDERSFAQYSAHVHDETPITAEVTHAASTGGRWAQVTIGGPLSPVHLVINVWDRDTLRRLADAAALAYHEWTKAETEANWQRELDGGPPADPTGVDCAERYNGIDA